VIDKLLILEETLFSADSFSGYSSDLESESVGFEEISDSMNLNGTVVAETKRREVQEKRLYEFYNLAMKNRKRALQERLEQTSKHFEEGFPELNSAANGSQT